MTVSQLFLPHRLIERATLRGSEYAWVLNPTSMTRVKYVVCTRNADMKHDEECGERPEAHRSAFLVGKVSGIRKVDHRNGRDRYIILFSEFAEVSIPEFRGNERNPVTYSDTLRLFQKGLDVKKLKFKPMPESEVDGGKLLPTQANSGLTIQEAKEGLASHFGLSTENIQIIISG